MILIASASNLQQVRFCLEILGEKISRDEMRNFEETFHYHNTSGDVSSPTPENTTVDLTKVRWKSSYANRFTLKTTTHDELRVRSTSWFANSGRFTLGAPVSVTR